MGKKRLALITMDDLTNELLFNQLTSLFGDSVSIERCTTEDNVCKYIDAPVALVSSVSLKVDVENKFRFGDKTKVIMSRRSIGKQGLKNLLEIPMGSRGILFIGHKDVSRDTVQLIKQLGITHFELQPEQSAQSDFDADLIITAGKANQLKDVNLPVVDIGILRLDITTIVEVLSALYLLDSKASLVSARYEREVIELCQEVSHALGQATIFSKELEVAINTNRDGMVMMDEAGRIVVSNQAAEELFKLPRERMVGRLFTRENGFPWNWEDLHTVDNSILMLHDYKLVVNASPVETPLGKIGTMLTFRDVTEIQRLEEMVRRDLAAKGHVARFTFQDIIGESTELKSVVKVAQRIAKTEATILIYGESGVGKELFAQAIHSASLRRNGPFVAVNFSALSESLMESELFGYDEGAFTGAKKGGKPGLFEMAHGGTIFLDEIGDASPALQTRLLRVLQEKQVMRVGATKIIPVDVRVIAATNKDLPGLIKKGTFRQDLYYRLNVLPLNIPPLRERRGDVLFLMQHFFVKRGHQLNVIPSALQLLDRYDWPGNTRELQNVVEYLYCTSSADEIIGEQNLPRHFLSLSKTNTLGSKNSGDLFKQLSENAPMEDYTLLLKTIKDSIAQGKSAGRRSLFRSIPGMTEARLRVRLKELQDVGLVVLMSGRRGTRITERGLALLDSMS